MKSLAALLLAIALFAAPSHASEPWYYPETHLGQPVQMNGLWYVPVIINNPGLWNIHNFWGWGDTDADLELTGTLRPASQGGDQGHLNGDYFPHLVDARINRNFPGDSTTSFGKWKLSIYGAYELPHEGSGDCQSIPTQTGGVLAYIHLIGTGTMRMTRDRMWSGTACDLPYFYYWWMANDRWNSVYIDDNPPTCYDCGEEGGGGDDPMGHLRAGAEAPKEVKATTKRSTWAKVKSYYR